MRGERRRAWSHRVETGPTNPHLPYLSPPKKTERKGTYLEPARHMPVGYAMLVAPVSVQLPLAGAPVCCCQTRVDRVNTQMRKKKQRTHTHHTLVTTARIQNVPRAVQLRMRNPSSSETMPQKGMTGGGGGGGTWQAKVIPGPGGPNGPQLRPWQQVLLAGSKTQVPLSGVHGVVGCAVGMVVGGACGVEVGFCLWGEDGEGQTRHGTSHTRAIDETRQTYRRSAGGRRCRGSCRDGSRRGLLGRCARR